MKVTLLVLGALVVAYVLYSSIRFLYLIQVSKRLTENTTPFTQNSGDTSVAMLVLGDSSAVGVGADTPVESVPGKAATYIGATSVENYAVSGGLVKDLPVQVAKASLSRYRLILVQIGGNDMVRFHDAGDAAAKLGSMLGTLPPADRVIVISAADLGTAPIFPLPLRPLYSRVNRQYHAAFAKTAGEHEATYVDLSKAPGGDAFKADPGTYFAPDQFHPSSAGYGLWFEAIREYLEEH